MCFIKDDFFELMPMLERADVIVFSMPIYWYGIPAQMEAVIDIFYACQSRKTERLLKIKESVFLACGADTNETVFHRITQQYSSIADYMGWKKTEILTVNGLMNKGKIDYSIYLNNAESMGLLL